jgi:hypothetical protein
MKLRHYEVLILMESLAFNKLGHIELVILIFEGHRQSAVPQVYKGCIHDLEACFEELSAGGIECIIPSWIGKKSRGAETTDNPGQGSRCRAAKT